MSVINEWRNYVDNQTQRTIGVMCSLALNEVRELPAKAVYPLVTKHTSSSYAQLIRLLMWKPGEHIDIVSLIQISLDIGDLAHSDELGKLCRYLYGLHESGQENVSGVVDKRQQNDFVKHQGIGNC